MHPGSLEVKYREYGRFFCPMLLSKPMSWSFPLRIVILTYFPCHIALPFASTQSLNTNSLQCVTILNRRHSWGSFPAVKLERK